MLEGNTKASDEKYAGVINNTAKSVTFEGCPSSIIGSVLGCNMNKPVEQGKVAFIIKPKGPLTSNSIWLKVNGVGKDYVEEGKMYAWNGSKLEYQSSIEEWRNSRQSKKSN